ncbi:HD domain-containing protein [Halomarina oriensis]|uniref:HD domain-containing protein n=1 Tax=Halomarina oriensis TaxID=671145 RepID=A0A6B0GMR8_9EURY|nr:HD domain-containing protein [Halomarina oriensis]MWG34937.1 HD domain-containing protein [Halomarina oriensis]
MTRQFKDPVHGYVDLDERIVERVVDTAPFQRLRRVRQLSATHLVYPGATHTRFEHSLGVYHLGQRVFENLRTQSYFTDGIGTDELDTIERTLAFACLLHDVGHPPLSHLGERHLDAAALRERLDGLGLHRAFEQVGVPSVDGLPVPVRRANPHELLGCVTVLDVYGDAIEAFGVDPHEVCAYVLGWSLRYEAGDHWQHGVAAELLHSPIDVDRLDYIIRDDDMTGADVLSVDTERMVAAYTAHPDAGLALSEKALSTIGNYLEGRISLYMWVTQHHKSVYANVLVRRLLDELAAHCEDSPITADAVLDGDLDDHAVLDRFRRTARDPPSEAFADLYERYRTRRFAESCWKHRLGYADVVAAEGEAAVDDYTRWLLANDEFLERALARELDVPVHEVWIERSYVPEYEPAELKDIPLAHNGRTQSVGEYGLYGDRAFDRSIPFVYVPKGHVDRTVELLNERYRDEW